jgi:3-methyladenine DNA glycosylase AlkD
MELLMDNPEVERTYKRIIAAIPSMQNGFTAESLEKRGLKYEKNYGASIVDLKVFSRNFEKNHLLALKLWNKKWRESMILATLLEEPPKINEEQMDYWVKTAGTIEIIEQAVSNLFVETPYAFVKSLEWCRSKKQNVKHAGLLMMGRLALTSDKSIDEMYEPFFKVITPLTKDPKLSEILNRSVCQLARRSKNLYRQCVNFANEVKCFDENQSQKFGSELHRELESADFIALVRQ